MAIPKPIRGLLWGTLALIGLIVVSIALLAFVHIPIDLTAHKAVFETIASQAINRPVTIDTSIKVATSLWPAFTIEGLRIGSPPDFQASDLARMQRARLQVRILPLLAMKIHVQEFSVAGLSLFLEENKAGAVNWTFGKSEAAAEKPSAAPASAPQPPKMTITSDSLLVKRIDLSDISVVYRSATDLPLEFNLDRCTGSVLIGQPLRLDLAGTLLAEPFTASVEVASLQEFFDHNRSWTELAIDIANASLKLSGNVDLATASRSLQLKATLAGQQLDHFNRMFQLDLPPVPEYGLTSVLTWTRGRLELSDLELRVSDSRLLGRMAVIKTDRQPQIDIELQSPMIQIDDFTFPDWTPRADEPPDGEVPAADEKADNTTHARIPGAKLLAPESLKTINARLKVSAEQILSGDDPLGSGHMTAELKDGRITIEPLELNLPGGSLHYSMSVKPDPKKSDAWVQAKIDNFDFGVLVHRVDPTSNMGGTFDLDMALKTEAATLDDVLANGNGHFDFSARPRNFRAGILDLWSVNLLVAVVARSDENQSNIECVIGRWSMKDGRLQPEALVIDTTRMRICCSGWVDFKQEEVNLKMAPVPKKPAFFSLATPIGVQGKFSDYKLGIIPGGLLGTSLRFVFSPIHVPIARLAGPSLPADGADVCGLPIGAGARPISLPAGCRSYFKKNRDK